MSKLIMMVDDDPAILRLYRTMVEPLGYDVLEATDGASVLEMLGETAPDLFILDVMMPEINGIELCQRLRELPEHEHTPLLILSAWGDAKIIEQAFAAGANDYLVKPVQRQELEAKIHELLEAEQPEPRP